MAERPDILIAALSGRALAAAARRAGFAPLVLDLFADADTRSLTRERCRVVGDLAGGFNEEALLAGAAELAPLDREPPAPLVVGSGFEDRLALLGRLAMGRTLLGNPPAIQALVKDPLGFAALCESQRVPTPETSLEPPRDAPGWPGDWLVKRVGASGGGHIRRARADDGAAPGRYFQRFVAGRSLSALFLADAGRARILGFSTLWSAGHGDAPPYLFGGAAGPVTLPAESFVRVRAWLDDLVAASGLRGLNSADLIESGQDLSLVEINPRPGATLDLFDRRKGPSLLAAHVEACQGRLRAPRLEANGLRALQVLYAERPLRVPDGLSWPDWSADRPLPGSEIPRGAPVCTIFATAEGPEAARAELAGRAGTILGQLAPGGPDACCA